MLLLSLLFILAARQSYAGTAFIGCYTVASLPAVTPISGSLPSSNADCAMRCGGAGYLYSFSDGTATAAPTICVCSANPAALSGLTTSSVDHQMCSSGSYFSQIALTSYTFGSCGQGDGGSVASDTTNVQSFESCFSICSPHGSLVYRPGTLECTCGAGTDQGAVFVGVPGACPASTTYAATYAFNHVAASTFSGYARRKLLERQEQNRLNTLNAPLCPAPLQACKVGVSRDSFECIDTEFELESCGGCIDGVVGHSAQNATGIDCTTIPGVPESAVTCLDGKCVAYACEDGFQLSSGACHRS